MALVTALQAHGIAMDEFSNDLRRLLKLTQAVREVHSQLPPQFLHILLVVAAKPGVSQSEIGRQTGLSSAAVSRDLGRMSVINRQDELGFGLLEQVPNSLDARSYSVFLTVKGRGVVQRLLQAATGKPAEAYSPPTVR